MNVDLLTEADVENLIDNALNRFIDGLQEKLVHDSTGFQHRADMNIVQAHAETKEDQTTIKRGTLYKLLEYGRGR